MPTDSTAAPRPYRPPLPSLAAAAASLPRPRSGAPAVADSPSVDADKQHRPREGRARLLDPSVTREQRDERPLRPVIDVPGGVAEVAHVRAAGDIEGPPERFVGD